MDNDGNSTPVEPAKESGSQMAKKSSESDKDRSNALNVTGRYQSIPARPADEFRRCTLAAGAVLWRGELTEPESVEVVVIHRPRYDDWSLAKG